MNEKRQVELLLYLQTTSTLQVLRDARNGKESSSADEILIEDIQSKYSFPLGVMNVLVEYAVLTSNKKLIPSYVRAIAQYWSNATLKMRWTT